MLNGRLIFVFPSRRVVALFKYCEDFREISFTPLIVTVRHAQFRQARHSCVCRSVLDYTVDIGELSERHRVSVVLTGLIITQNRQTRTEGRRETPTESRQDVLILLNTSCSYFCYSQLLSCCKDSPFGSISMYAQYTLTRQEN